MERKDALSRLGTGVSGLDAVLGGGLPAGGIHVLAGSPGAGKTILASQACFAHVAAGGTAIYVTLLAENHGRLISQLERLSFFDAEAVGRSLMFVNGYPAIDSAGLDGLLELLRGEVRARRATLLVLDGLVTAELFAQSQVGYRKFIQALQTWVGMVGTTVLFLTSARADASRAEHTMVDGIVELEMRIDGRRTLRELRVSKLRGTAFMEGIHPYTITGDGVVVSPRAELALRPTRGGKPGPTIPTGVPGLDALIGGGWISGSATLVLGSSGSGKTILGLQHLAAAGPDERALHVGLFEDRDAILAKADRLALPLRAMVQAGRLEIAWHPAAEVSLDALVHDLLARVDRLGAKRVFFDGFAGLKGNTPYPERVGGVFAMLTEQLHVRGVTTVMSEETRELFIKNLSVPTTGVSALTHNIILLRQMEERAELIRAISVMKVRDSRHSRVLHTFEITEQGVVVGRAVPGSSRFFDGQTRLRATRRDEK